MKVQIRITPLCPECGYMMFQGVLDRPDVFRCTAQKCKKYGIKLRIKLEVEAEEVE